MAEREAGGTGETFERLGRFVAGEMERLQVPGAAVGVLHAGREEVAGYGVTGVEHPLPVTPDTLFQIGSITKTVTATAAMRLTERDEVDLDAPVRTYLPALRLREESVAARVTLRHLFTHVGGWFGDYFADTGAGDDALALMIERMAELPQLTPLGALYSYNNIGIGLAGRVVEVVAGRPYEAAARELVLEPLGMAASRFFPAEVMTERFVVGHHLREGRPQVARPWALTRGQHSFGGLASTVRDQLRYARFHLGDGAAGDGTRLLRPETMALMRSPLVPAGCTAEHLGISWMLNTRGGVRTVGHGGATNGQKAHLLLVPERAFAVSVLTNADPGDELHQAATQWALREYLGVDEPEPAERALPDGALRAYTGRYTGQTQDLDLTTDDDGHLVLQDIPTRGFPTLDSPPPPADAPVRLAFYAEDRVICLDPPARGARGEFLRDAEGRLEWLRFGGRLHARQG